MSITTGRRKNRENYLLQICNSVGVSQQFTLGSARQTILGHNDETVLVSVVLVGQDLDLLQVGHLVQLDMGLHPVQYRTLIVTKTAVEALDSMRFQMIYKRGRMLELLITVGALVVQRIRNIFTN